jgi:hypothetical protein
MQTKKRPPRKGQQAANTVPVSPNVRVKMALVDFLAALSKSPYALSTKPKREPKRSRKTLP